MKYICTLILVYVLFPIYLLSQTGSSCSTPYTLTLDGVQRSYATTSNTGSAVVCTIAGTSPVTYFTFTTNAMAEMPLLHIIAPGGTDCEIAMYLGNCTNGNLQVPSSMCFWDGQGLWAPAHNYTLLPNTAYNLRIKTATAGNILIAAQSYTPANNTCAGARSIGPTLTNDNNACHRPGTGVTPGQLCATTLENTAFYTYTVETTGVTAVSIENATCDNGDGTAQVGFQVGFFTGNCSSMFFLQCYAGFGTNVQANTGILAAGTVIYVAVDGIGGSNCQYSVRAINGVELSATLKYFSAWKENGGNMLRWISLREVNNEIFEIQRSTDGSRFTTIGSVRGQVNSSTEKRYQFEDVAAPDISYYRLKQISTNGKVTYSNIVKLDRGGLNGYKIKINNPVSGMMNMTIAASNGGTSEIFLRNINGQVIFRDKINCLKGINTYIKDISHLPKGIYSVTVTGNGLQDTQSLLKM